MAGGAAARAEAPDDAPENEADTPPEAPSSSEAPRSAPPAAPASSQSPVEPPQAPPAGVDPIPATSPAGVQHLGPESFPGRSRGLYGGSLWLEPSFNVLQLPYLSQTGVGVSGSSWLDSGYEAIKRGKTQIPNSAMPFLQGRGVLRLTPTYVRGSLFIQGQVELVGNMCQSTTVVCMSSGTFSTDDLWIRVGQWNRWDLKVGRFEAWEVYHLGMGMEPYTFERLGAGNFGVDTMATPVLEAPQHYGVTYLHDRPTDGVAVGYAALHAYPTDSLRFELLGKYGTDNNIDDNSTGGKAATYLGSRPTAILDIGWLKLKVGAEYEKRALTTQTVDPGMPQKKDPVANRVRKGAGASLQLVFLPIVEFGLNAAIGSQHEENGFAQVVPENSFTTKSVGGFANVRLTDLLLVGGGANWTIQTDSFLAMNATVNDVTSHLQTFLAVQYLLAGQLFIKGDFALARAYFQPSDTTITVWTNNMYSGRVRLMYLY